MPRRTFDDVILPPASRRALDTALAQVTQHDLIFNRWGHGERHPTGLALAFNFAGPPGTGKTFEELQQQLEQELRRAAFDRLKANVLPAANAWVDSLHVAARKGDYRGARDLLLHTKVIEPVTKDEGSGITIHIGGHAADVKLGIAVSSDSDPSPLSKITG